MTVGGNMRRRTGLCLAAVTTLLAACNNTAPPSAAQAPAAGAPAATAAPAQASSAKPGDPGVAPRFEVDPDRKSTRLNSSHT